VALLELGCQLGQRERSEVAGGHLDGERQPVEQLDHPGDQAVVR
jgi:hypothetical protein